MQRGVFSREPPFDHPLFAALGALEGKEIGECMARRRHREFLNFLRRLDRELPAHLDLHLIVDHYGTHQKPEGKAWLVKHPRFHRHFIPSSSAWLNRIERWLRELMQPRPRRGSLYGVEELAAAIEEYRQKAHRNEPTQPTQAAR